MDRRIVAQQEFLKNKGMYKGAIDGQWGPMSIEAMKAWSCQCNSGHLDGSPIDGRRPVPEGYTLEDGMLLPIKAPEPVSPPVAPPEPPATTQVKKPALGLSSVAVPNPQLQTDSEAQPEPSAESGSEEGSTSETDTTGDQTENMFAPVLDTSAKGSEDSTADTK